MSRPHSSSVDADTGAWGGSNVTSYPVTSLHDNDSDLDTQAEPPQHDSDDADTMAEKERMIADIVTKQDGLKALLQRVQHVQNESAKLKSNNETLQTYIDNLTRANATALGAANNKR
ncbi:hypothetical protein OIO90_002598 [Microbotryomycetes sp. JL221]|nr:hypothetical protein OIO90_002598 [Microbotryomycetes sp. JL221]